MKPDGSFNFAISPAKKPMTSVQRIPSYELQFRSWRQEKSLIFVPYHSLRDARQDERAGMRRIPFLHPTPWQ
jgi:hypothetical protein